MERFRLTALENHPDSESQFDQIAELGSELNVNFLELYSLYQIAAILSEKIEIDAAFDVVARLLDETFQIEKYALFLVDQQSQELTLKNVSGFNVNKQLRKAVALDEGVFEEAFRDGKPVLLEDLGATNGQFRSSQLVREKNGSFLCIPLLSPTTEEPLGALNLYRSAKNAFSKSESQTFSRLAVQFSRVLDQIIIYQQVCELTFTDELTQIYNRRYFNQRFEREMVRAQRYKRPLSVLMVDIDHFKSFNDTHGHFAGDEVLKTVAKTLEESLRKADIIARFGGEEFVIILPEINKKKALGVAEKLRRAVEQIEFDLAYSQPLGKITVSLGLASFPEISSSGADLLKKADAALYKAKANGRNCVVAAPAPKVLAQQKAELDFQLIGAPLSPA